MLKREKVSIFGDVVLSKAGGAGGVKSLVRSWDFNVEDP